MLNGAPELAIDLGAGPGHTTELLAEVTRARAVIGYERSPDFCAQEQGGGQTSSGLFEDVHRDPIDLHLVAPRASLASRCEPIRQI
jgi:hypothetical protein